MSGGASAIYYDPYKTEITANPYPVFKRLRDDAPLYYNEEFDFYAVSRYEDVERGLRDQVTFSSARGAILEVIKANPDFPPGLLIFNDPPSHTQYRTLLQRMFTPKRMTALETRVREICAECLDPFVGTEGFDFIANLGSQMPMRIIGALLGIPEKDYASVRESVDARMRTDAGKPMSVEFETIGEGFEEYVDWRVKNPSDDVMTELMTNEFTDEQGVTRRLTRDEVLTLVNVLAGAGNETTNRLIGWSGKVLAEHPEQRRLLVENPGLIPQAIEELLRFEPPAPHMSRYVTRDIELHGRKVPEGSVMMMLTGSANRDDRRFGNGDVFDVRRERRSHLTFGFGIHTCVGAVLARLEGRIALEEVLKRFPNWEVDLDRAVLSPTSSVRGWETLPAYFAGRPAGTGKPQPKSEAAPVAANGPPASVDGTWKITLKGPTGAIDTVLELDSKTGKLAGTQSGQGMSSPILDATYESGKIRWINQVTKPMKLKVEFSGTVDGNTISGKAKAGFMGSFPFTGVKA